MAVPTLRGLDLSKPMLVLAPHLQYPLRNGADLLVDRSAVAMSHHIPRIDLVGEQEHRTYAKGLCIAREPFQNKMRGPAAAAIRTALFRTNYLMERFVTSSYRRRIRSLLRSSAYGSVWYSFAEIASELRAEPGALNFEAAWTHNDQVKWFRTLQHSTQNPFRKWVAWQSGQWYREQAARISDLTHVYVTEADRQGHTDAFGPHPSLVMPIGTDVLDPS
ncbi:MAG: hypothetical protein AAF624_18075, partial [Bacteroidota bacterium]